MEILHNAKILQGAHTPNHTSHKVDHPDKSANSKSKRERKVDELLEIFQNTPQIQQF
jgi:hypothetical protein